MATYRFRDLHATNKRIDMLMADFSGMVDLENIVVDVLNRLALNENVNQQLGLYKSGAITMQAFDGWFSEVVLMELGKTLGIIRNKAKKKAEDAGAGSASSGVLRRSYKDEYKGNINISGNRRRISSRERIVPEPRGGNSGIRRSRYVGERTKQMRKYFGPDRSMVLRWLSFGTDVRTAQPYGPTGNRSLATYGKRGTIAARHFFHQMQNDMEQAANHLGDTLMNHVEKWTEQKFEETGK